MNDFSLYMSRLSGFNAFPNVSSVLAVMYVFHMFNMFNIFKGLAAPCTTKTSTPVERVERRADGTVLVTDAAGGSSVFDRVIYACNARSAEETLQV